jgi:nicotinamidase/pyrazinamidase
MHDVILFDVDTQVDFLYPVGALYVPGAERIIPNLARLYALGLPVIATADAHADEDPEFQQWPPHCVAGTLGQKKPAETLRGDAVVIPNAAGDFPAAWQQASQLIVEKQTLDVFETQTIERILGGRPARRYLVCGVVTEVCVIRAARGLLRQGREVEIVTDAIAALSPAAGQAALDELCAAGATLTTVAALRAA